MDPGGYLYFGQSTVLDAMADFFILPFIRHKPRFTLEPGRPADRPPTQTTGHSHLTFCHTQWVRLVAWMKILKKIIHPTTSFKIFLGIKLYLETILVITDNLFLNKKYPHT